jgi:transaldolase
VVKIFLDSADIQEMREAQRRVQGFTCNPSIMRKAGVKDYEVFARYAVNAFPNKPLSFEVIADDFNEMERQAHKIASWGKNVYVKIPITNTHGESACELIKSLARAEVKVNVTAVFNECQVQSVFESLQEWTPSIISIFAGRIADTGRDPTRIVKSAVQRKNSSCQVLWASPRQVFDVYMADSCQCDIITITKDILAKLPLEGKNLASYSLDTVKMFYSDARAAGYSL